MRLARDFATCRLSWRTSCRGGPLDLGVRTTEWNDRAMRTLARQRHDMAVRIKRQILKRERLEKRRSLIQLSQVVLIEPAALRAIFSGARAPGRFPHPR